MSRKNDHTTRIRSSKIRLDRPPDTPSLHITTYQTPICSSSIEFPLVFQTKSRTFLSLTESPGLDTAISVVGRQEIESLHADSVVDALKYVTGAWTESRRRKVKQ